MSNEVKRIFALNIKTIICQYWFQSKFYLEEVDCLVHDVLLLRGGGGGAPGAALGCLLERHDGHLADVPVGGGQAGVESGHCEGLENLSDLKMPRLVSRELLSYQLVTVFCGCSVV